VERVGLSGTTLESLGAAFCRGCWNLPALALPPTLKSIGDDFLFCSPSVERVDLSGTVLARIGGSFCRDCGNLRELLLPGTLASLDPAACIESPLSLLFLPVAGGVELEGLDSTSIMSGLTGLGSVPARPMWPAK
jgi:hypothetical protein